jgi:CutA1 divalent ion tolerance protein
VLSIGALSTIAFRKGALHSTGMDTSSTTVPFIVVYVTVPNKEAGKKLSESIVKEKLATCVKPKFIPAKPLSQRPT